MEEEKCCQIALTRVPTIGYVHTKLLLDHFGSAAAVFTAGYHELQNLEGIGPMRARKIREYAGFQECKKEVEKAEALGLRLICYTDPSYPAALKECYDPPGLLFVRGTASLHQERSVAIIGTRNHSEYGRQMTSRIVKELTEHQVCIISGMAYGIDGIAHSTALESGGITIGVLAHGLDHIYPSAHTGMAREVVQKGGILLTEFPIGQKAQKHHFPIRNRIVAGISKAVIIIETGTRGGSMITANMANGYNIPVFALPGRLTDKSSTGCNQLIRDQKAILFNSVEEFMEEMQWTVKNSTPNAALQPALFPELDAPATLLVNLLGKHGTLPLDQLYILSGLDAGLAAKAVLDLELGGLIRLLPGRRYTLA